MGCAGLKFKLYWRILPGHEGWHCFSLAPKGERVGGRYVSLCGRERIAMVYGQDINRLRAVLRCRACDTAEMGVRGVDEGMEDRITHPERPLHSMATRRG